ncbi:MAG TPA: penicillin-binding transpeptidase domain-containing protein [Candidatus Sulfotelmatobacter sp.]|jgi:cell division protein FtsI/penicillin-binding protein 2
MRSIPILLLLLSAPISPCRTGNSGTAAGSLFAQAASQALAREFPDPDISYLLFDARTGALIASSWEHPDIPIPLGSLAKPFAALAYGERHAFRYPAHRCRGTGSGCWRPGGHGDVDLTSAIAFSCNSYFRMLTSNLSSADMWPVAARFGLDPPDATTHAAALAGLGPEWKISPLRMAVAYLGIVHHRDEPGVASIIDGMEQSAREGTGAEVDRSLAVPNALAKTGTAECTHARHAPGDGFTVALAPAQNPKLLIMVRVHGIPGAKAAKTAGQMLRTIGS